MARQQDREEGDAVVAAIEHVLSVERDGVQQLRTSEAHAQRLLAAARAQAAAITARADSCIARLHDAYLQKVQHNIEHLMQANSSSRSDTGMAYDPATILEAARRVAGKLTGAP